MVTHVCRCCGCFGFLFGDVMAVVALFLRYFGRGRFLLGDVVTVMASFLICCGCGDFTFGDVVAVVASFFGDVWDVVAHF